MFGTLQWGILMLLSVGALIAGVWGIVDAARYQSSTYVAARKQSKALWLVILIAASAIAFISVPAPIGRGDGIIGFLGIAAVAAIAVYFATVRPALRQHEPRRGGGRRGGSGSTGGW
jgi:hypothetical protein